MRDLFKKLDPRLYPDMNWIDNACLVLKETIEHNLDFVPELILGIAFGGLVPAAMLSVILRLPLATVRIQAYDEFNNPKAPLFDEEAYTFPRVPTLVVDDIADSGRTLDVIMKLLIAYEIEAECATLHVKPQSIIQPRYSACKIDAGWVEYPWEKR